MQVQLPSSPHQVRQARAAAMSVEAGALHHSSSLLTAKTPWYCRAPVAPPERPSWRHVLCPAAVPTALLTALPRVLLRALLRAPLTPSAPSSLQLLMVPLLTGRVRSALLLPRRVQLWVQGQADMALLVPKGSCVHQLKLGRLCKRSNTRVGRQSRGELSAMLLRMWQSVCVLSVCLLLCLYVCLSVCVFCVSVCVLKLNIASKQTTV